MQRAIEAGINTIEHAVPLEGVTLSKEKKDLITFVPTFVSAYDVMSMGTIISKMKLDRSKAKLFDATNTKAVFDVVPDSIAEWFDRLTTNLPKAISTGTKIAIGSDAGCIGTRSEEHTSELQSH